MNFIEANGASLRYIVEGVGKPIVLIHEMGGTMESWGLVAPLLASHRRVIRYDTRGAGFSEKIRSALKIDIMTGDLIALLDGLGIKERVALAGTAVGGAIALHAAFRFPERISAAVVTSPATSIPPANRDATLARVAKFESEGLRTVFDGTAANGYPEELRGDGRNSPAGAHAGSPTIRRALRRSIACLPTWISRRSSPRSSARCW